MKKFLRLITLASLAFILVACQQEPEEVQVESNPPVESSQSVEPSSDPASEEVSSEQASDNEAENVESTEENNEAAEEETGEEIQFVFYLTNEDTPIAEFTANVPAGTSILDAMNTIEELDFNFNEDEGVIDQIGEYSNDYATGETWVYLYNGEYAELGVVSQTLEPGDEITWYFGYAEDIPMNLVIE